MVGEKLLNTDQAAVTLGRSKTTVLNWIRSGILSAVRGEDGRWYITEKDLDDAKAVMAERRRLRSIGKGDDLQRDSDGLKDDPVLLIVKAIVKDELKVYQNRLAKGLDTQANESYIRSKDFAMLTGGLVDPEELIKRMRLKYARRAK